MHYQHTLLLCLCLLSYLLVVVLSLVLISDLPDLLELVDPGLGPLHPLTWFQHQDLSPDQATEQRVNQHDVGRGQQDEGGETHAGQPRHRCCLPHMP